jgi:hypothetical protein
MARILLLDETAAAERFSSDQSKNANIGSGAGPGRVSAASTTFCNASAQLASGRCVPPSVVPSTGLITLGSNWDDFTDGSFSSSITISSTRSRTVVACVEGQGNAQESDCVDYPTTLDCTGSITTGFPDFWLSDTDTSGNFTIQRFTLYQKPCCSDVYGDNSARYTYI